jgi:hypothetical protein
VKPPLAQSISASRAAGLRRRTLDSTLAIRVGSVFAGCVFSAFGASARAVTAGAVLGFSPSERRCEVAGAGSGVRRASEGRLELGLPASVTGLDEDGVDPV